MDNTGESIGSCCDCDWWCGCCRDTDLGASRTCRSRRDWCTTRSNTTPKWPPNTDISPLDVAVPLLALVLLVLLLLLPLLMPELLLMLLLMLLMSLWLVSAHAPHDMPLNTWATSATPGTRARPWRSRTRASSLRARCPSPGEKWYGKQAKAVIKNKW